MPTEPPRALYIHPLIPTANMYCAVLKTTRIGVFFLTSVTLAYLSTSTGDTLEERAKAAHRIPSKDSGKAVDVTPEEEAAPAPAGQAAPAQPAPEPAAPAPAEPAAPAPAAPSSTP